MTQPATAPRAPERHRHGSPKYWVCQGVGWGQYILITVLQASLRSDLSRGTLAEILFAACFGVALTHGFRRFLVDRRWPSLELRALVPRALLAPLVLACIFVAPLVVIEHYLLGERPPSMALDAVFAVIRWTLIFSIWELLYLGVEARARAETQRRELTRVLQAAQLRSLESQLNPHFLFNALNTVRALISEDPARAQMAVTQMASILRHALGSGRDNLVTFESEMSAVDDYLAIEELRLGDRLRVERVIDEAAARTRIPAMLLQTLVENAVKHGIAELRGGGTLAICARVEDGAMLLTVDNPRPLDEERARSMETHSGIGLANATERLRLLFGERASLEMDLSQPRQATARVRIPLQP